MYSLVNSNSKYKIETRVYKPNGELYNTWKRVQDQKELNKTESFETYRGNKKLYRAYYGTIDLKTEYMKNYPGEWKVEFYIDGEMVKTKTFSLSVNQTDSVDIDAQKEEEDRRKKEAEDREKAEVEKRRKDDEERQKKLQEQDQRNICSYSPSPGLYQREEVGPDHWELQLCSWRQPEKPCERCKSCENLFGGHWL